MSLLEGLRFTKGDSPMHRMDPRVKFLMTMVIFTLSILFLDLIPLMVVFTLQIPIVIYGRIWREWLKSLKGGAFLAVIIFATNLLSFYFFRGMTLSGDIVEYSLSLTLRFLSLITSFSLFFLTTSPDKLSLALEKAKVPYEFNFAFITAIRFVPVLADEAQTIMDAQRSRGLELDKGGFLSRIRKYIPILLPLIINSIRRSLELAEAMESRAFGATKNRTNLYELKMARSDYFALIIIIVALALALYARFFMPPFPKVISGILFA
ncbi:MAG: energy-coupling factor transporter transmembrane component T [Candidatus Bathyarchaeota archaeon]|nr:energy-coupling factor transporter transmembrane component T [Candidatus Bathyarchaeota archaeon]